MKATLGKERIAVLDALRGWALLGILLVNATFYSTPLQAILWQTKLGSGWNRAVEIAVSVLVEGKFLAIFAFLFGYGAVLFQTRAEARGRSFGRLFRRRLFLLLLFGLAHGLLLWFGDILLHYALLGFVLLAFHRAKPRTLLLWAVGLLGVMTLLALAGSGADLAGADPEFAHTVHEFIAHDEVVYATGSWRDVQPLRGRDWVMSAANQVVFYPQILALFLLGAYAARRGLLHDVSVHRRILVRIAWATGVVGWASAALHTAVLLDVSALAPFRHPIEGWAIAAGAPALGLFYVTAFALVHVRTREAGFWRPFVAVGRTAFTNYIMQSVLCTLIFYGYGLGLYGKTGPGVNALIALAVFGLQLAVSTWWTARFPTGPLERLWRIGTYGVTTPRVRSGSVLPKDGR